MSQKYLTRNDTIADVIKVVKKLENHQNCTTNIICKAVKKQHKNIPNYIIRDALRAAERQNKLMRKQNTYFISSAPPEQTKCGEKVKQNKTEELKNDSTNKFKRVKNSITNLKGLKDKVQHGRRNLKRKKYVHIPVKYCRSKIQKKKSSIGKSSNCSTEDSHSINKAPLCSSSVACCSSRASRCSIKPSCCSTKTSRCSIKPSHCSIKPSHCSIKPSHCSIKPSHCSIKSSHCSSTPSHCSAKSPEIPPIKRSPSQANVKYVCANCKAKLSSKESKNSLPKLEEDHLQVKHHANESIDTGLVSRLVANCKRFFLLPIIDPNCDLSDFK